MQDLLNEIETNLHNIHYPLSHLESYVFDYETDELNKQVQQIHNGYMTIQEAINHIRKLKE